MITHWHACGESFNPWRAWSMCCLEWFILYRDLYTLKPYLFTHGF
jgi:hypothetical protein